MKEFYKIALYSFIFFVFLSCDKEPENIESKNNSIENMFKIKDGYVYFESVILYDKVVKAMSLMNYHDLEAFKNHINIQSLHDFTRENENPDSENKHLEDEILAMLLNKDGILVVNDTILKIVNDEAFLICDGDFGKLEMISKGEFPNMNIIQKPFTKKLRVSNSESGMQKLRGTETEIFPVVNTPALTHPTKPSIAREERVKLKAFCVISPFWPFGLTYIGAEMEGEARHENGLFGGWGSWFNDEIQYGTITINSGKYGIPPNYTQDVTTGGASFTTPLKSFKIGLEYGASNNLHVQNLNVTYTYKKNPWSAHTVNNIIWQ